MRIVPLKLNRKPQMTTWVVDNFYADPMAVRNFALKQEFVEEKDYYKGCRTKHQYFLPGTVVLKPPASDPTCLRPQPLVQFSEKHPSCW